MKTIKNNQTGLAIAVTMILLMSASSSYAGMGGDHERNEHRSRHDSGGSVLSAKAQPAGYSLYDMAKATAAFNLTDHSGSFPDVVDGTPFQGLFTTATNTFDVDEETILYVPVLLNDDSAPVIGNFPNINNRKALESYFYSSKELGAEYTNITVDGKTTSLDDNYLVGVKFAQPLPDGAKQYMTVAAFLSPLKKGKHTVEISFLADGAAVAPWCDAINQIYNQTVCTTEYKYSTEYIVNVH